MQCKLCFVVCVAETGGEGVASSRDCRSRKVFAEPVRQGGRNGDSITDFRYAGGKGDVFMY